MTPRTNALVCRYAVILILLLIIPGMGYASGDPQWLQAYRDGTLKLNNAYYGVGSSEFVGNSPDDESRRRSKDRALDDLCYQLSVSIQSEFKEKLSQKGKFSDQEVASSLFVSTQKVFSGIQEKHKWTDAGKNRYWVMVIIDKAEADRQVEQQNFVKKVVDRLEHNQREIVSGIKKMTAVIKQQTQFVKHQMNKLDKFVKDLDTKLAAAGNQTKGEYAGIKNEISKMGDKFNSQEAMLHDQNKKMEVLMAQNKALQELFAKISNNIQRDHFLALTRDDIKNQSNNPEFKVKITPLKGQGAYYHDGESIQFRVEASKNCYIKVIYLSSIGDDAAGERRMNTLLFPNVYDRDNHIRAGKPMIIGKLGELVAQPPYGKDIVTVVASLSQFTDINESLRLAAASGRYYQSVTRNVGEAVRSRGIGVKHLKASSTDTCFIITGKR